MQDPQCFRLNPKLGQLNTTHHMSNAMIVEGAKDEALVEDIRDGGIHIRDMCLEFASMKVVNKGVVTFVENLAIFMQTNTMVYLFIFVYFCFSWNGGSSWMARK